MEFPWTLQHQTDPVQNGRHPNDHQEDPGINQVATRRLLAVTGKFERRTVSKGSQGGR